MEIQEFEGKISLVTGASRGLGRAIALKLAALGSGVVINYLASDEEASNVALRAKFTGQATWAKRYFVVRVHFMFHILISDTCIIITT